MSERPYNNCNLRVTPELTETVRRTFAYDPLTGLVWRKSKPRYFGRLDTRGYIRFYVGGTSLQAHRIAWLLAYGGWPPQPIDHINCVKTDNRLCNLRLADAHLNALNRRHLRPNKDTGYVGVCVVRGKKSERFRVTFYSKPYYFNRLEDAVAFRRGHGMPLFEC